MKRFDIDQVRLYYENFSFTTVVMIKYFDHEKPSAKWQELKLELSDEIMESYDELSCMQFVAEKAAAAVKSDAFYDAMRDYFMYGYNDGYSYQYKPFKVGAAHKQHIHWVPDDKPKLSYHSSGLAFDFNEIKAVGGKITSSTIASKSFPIGYGSDVGSTKTDMDDIHQLPGINEKVKHPETGMMRTIKECIITLNDQHGWSRERVADWLETLDVDLTFKSPDAILKEKKKKALDKKITVLTKNIAEVTENLEKLKKQLEETTFQMLELEATNE